MKKLVLTVIMAILYITLVAQEATPNVPTDTVQTKAEHKRLLSSYVASLQDLAEQRQFIQAQLDKIESDITHTREKILLVGSMYADPRKILSVTPEGDIIKTKDVSKHSE